MIFRVALAGLVSALAVLLPSAASAANYAIGQRVECDPTLLHKYYKPGIVIAPHPGETYNGQSATSGSFYRVRLDGGGDDGALCPAEDMRPVQAAQQAAAPADKSGQAPMPALPARGPAAQPIRSGNKFGTREPQKCTPMRSQPSSPAQITALLRCFRENQTRDLIYLLENVAVESGGTRPYNYQGDHLNTDIDTTAPVLPIRGSLDAYQCAPLSIYDTVHTTYDRDNTGRDCAIRPEHKAAGICYRTTFGDWRCNMQEAIDPSLTRLDQPVPKR